MPCSSRVMYKTILFFVPMTMSNISCFNIGFLVSIYLMVIENIPEITLEFLGTSFSSTNSHILRRTRFSISLFLASFASFDLYQLSFGRRISTMLVELVNFFFDLCLLFTEDLNWRIELCNVFIKSSPEIID